MRRPVSQPVETSRTPWLDPGAISRDGRRGANRRGGEKPRGRNTVEPGTLGPEAAPRKRDIAAALTLRLEYGGGALFDNPKRGRSAGRLNGKDQNVSGKTARKIRRVERLTSLLARSDPPVGPRRFM